MWFALGFSTYAQGNEISQISVKMPEVKDRDLSALEDAAEDQPRVVRAAQPSRSL